MANLRETAAAYPDGIAAMGDDMEKFGGWPGTFEHCYEERWLDALFHAFEDNSSWLHVCTPGEYLGSHSPKGRADLPTASYTEMMEWALPTPTRQRYNALLKEFDGRPDVLAFLRGSPWRGFSPANMPNPICCTKKCSTSPDASRAGSQRRPAPSLPKN